MDAPDPLRAVERGEREHPHLLAGNAGQLTERRRVELAVKTVVVDEQEVRDQREVRAVRLEGEVRQPAGDVSLGVGRVVGEKPLGRRPEVPPAGVDVAVEVPDEQVPFLAEPGDVVLDRRVEFRFERVGQRSVQRVDRDRSSANSAAVAVNAPAPPPQSRSSRPTRSATVRSNIRRYSANVRPIVRKSSVTSNFSLDTV